MTEGAVADLPLLLLPGLDGTGVLFEPLLAHLPAGLRPMVVAYPPDEPLDYEDLLPRVLAAVPEGTGYAILGESFSGPLALRAANARPDGLAGVILAASFVRNPVRWASARLSPLLRLVPFRLYPWWQTAKAALGGYSSDLVQGLADAAMARVRPDVLACRIRSILAVDVTRELVACPAPVLYVQGDRDRLVPAHNVKAIRAARPSVVVATLPSRHLVLQTAPAAAAAAIGEFLLAPR